MNIWVTRYTAWVQLDAWIQAAPPADQQEMRPTLQGRILPSVSFTLYLDPDVFFFISVA